GQYIETGFGKIRAGAIRQYRDTGDGNTDVRIAQQCGGQQPAGLFPIQSFAAPRQAEIRRQPPHHRPGLTGFNGVRHLPQRITDPVFCGWRAARGERHEHGGLQQQKAAVCCAFYRSHGPGMHSRVDTALYPETEPWFQRWLAVGDGHELYVEQSGNPDGLPVLVLHGGPGGGCSPHMRRYFDPSRWRIILFDQRGAGRSRPMGGLQANTTEHLLADIALIRRELGIERWMLFGGSWGSTLALLYAQRGPEQVSALVLRGVFLCRREDMDWLYRDGASRIYPEAWASFLGGVPAAEAGDLVAAYYRRLCDDSDPATQQVLAMRWAGWEGACATLLPSPAVMAGFHARALALARIEAHYFAHQGFMPEG